MLEDTNIETNEAESTEPTTTEGSFLESITEELRTESSLQDIKDVNGLAKSYVSAQKMLGNSVRIPGSDASEQDRSEFLEKLQSVDGVIKAPDPDDAKSMEQLYNYLGRPQEATAYKAEVPEGIQLEEEGIVDFQKTAHSLGLTQKQYEGVMGKYIETIAAMDEQEGQRVEHDTSLLKEKWGSEYNNRVAGARAVLEHYAHDEKYAGAVKELIELAPNNPVLVSVLADLAPTYQEKGSIGGSTGVQYGVTAEEALAQYNEIVHNMDHPFYKGNKAAIDKADRLLRIARGA